MSTVTRPTGTEPDVTAGDPTANEPETTWRTFVRGLQLTPELRTGLAGTLFLALIATAGRVVVPIAVQQTIDHGLRGAGGPDLGLIATFVSVAAAILVATAMAAFFMNVRLFRTSETALANLRTKAFRHVHDLSMLHQQSERRGSLVSRVTWTRSASSSSGAASCCWSASARCCWRP
jgi:ATP-binding cassette subfamily B protein